MVRVAFARYATLELAKLQVADDDGRQGKHGGKSDEDNVDSVLPVRRDRSGGVP